MARSFIVYQGEDETPEYDLTDATSPVHVIWEEVEAGGRAFRGEGNANSIPMRDEQGETGDDVSLPSGLEIVSLSRGSKWVWLDGPDGAEVVMASGRIGVKDYSRGRQKADRAREITMQSSDRNEELTEIIVDDWVRGEETDVARVLALVAAYLNGSPRSTTVIATTYVAAGNTVTMPAKTYDGTNPKDVLNEIAQFASKNFFVTVDDELWYDTWDSTTYPAGLRISDRPEEWTIDQSSEPAASVRLYPASTDSGGGSGESLAAPNLGSGDVDAAWETVAGGFDYDYMFDTPAGTTTGATNSWAQVNASERDVIIAGFVHRLDGDLLSIVQNGGAVIGQHVCASRFGIGISEDSQMQFATFAVRVYRPGSSSFVATLVNVGDFVGDVRFPPQATNVNRTFGPVTFTPYPDAVEGDYVVIDVGVHHEAPVSGGTGAAVMWKDSYASDLPIDQQTTEDAELNSWWQFGPPEEALLTVGPRWDVGPSSTEDGLQLVSGLRLYYGQDDAYVTATHPETADEYWHAERSFYTQDPAIDDETKAQSLADAILHRMRLEERTYNVSVGPLHNEHVGLLKPGQLIDIKARAIPDADDQFVSRRIAQLRWTTPRAGVFWARMQLDRPVKEVPYGVGPKEGHDALKNHKTGDSHPASAIVITDAGGYFTGNDVEAALQELGDAVDDIDPATAPAPDVDSSALVPASSITLTKASGNPTFNFNAIPENMFRVGGTYYAVYQDGAASPEVFLATATDRDGPWTAGVSPILADADISWNAADTDLYAPELAQDPDDPDTWYLFYSVADDDDGTNGHIGVATSTAGIEGPYTDSGAAILSPGAAGLWDSLRVGEPSVMYHDGRWIMAYMGEDDDEAYQASERIGFATASSPTGTWTKAPGNPLIDWGGSGAWDDALTADPFIFFENGYYWCWYTGGQPTPWNAGLAYAIDPLGTWTKHPDNPLLVEGAGGTWEDEGAWRGSVWIEDGLLSGIYGGYPGGALSGAKGGNFRLTVTAPDSGAGALDDLSDVTITTPTEDDDLRFNGSAWVNDARKWEAVTDGEDTFVWEGDDLVHEWNA